MKENFSRESFKDKYEKEARVNIDLRKALDLMEEAEKSHENGDIEQAIELYKESIAYCPTADAHTYLGWMYSMQSRLEEAIEECHQAIEVDPDFGNPYNDIGCYLLEIDEIDEAEEWFKKAKRAPRYEPRHFPYMNLARVYMAKGQHGKALTELYRALQIEPGEETLQRQFADLLALLN